MRIFGSFNRAGSLSSVLTRAAASDQITGTSALGGRIAGPGLRRAFSGVMKSAVTDRLTRRQARDPMPADEVIDRNWRVLVARSREMTGENDYGRGYLRLVRQNVVGSTGVRLQAQVRDTNRQSDTGANDAIEAAWARWGKRGNCSMDGRRSFHRLEMAVIQSCARDGEFFGRIHTGRHAGPWGFAVQVIDPLRVPIEVREDYLPGGGFIRHGIEFDAYGRPLFYLVRVGDREPADRVIGGRRLARIPADQMIHVFVEDIEGQKRGLPWTATALWRLQMTAGFEDAALVNARAGAAKGGYLEWEEGYGPEIDSEDLVDEDPLYFDAEAGVVQELTPGLRYKDANPTYPSGEFSTFLKAMLRGAASGLGVAYNNFAGDLEGVNFSSIRQGTLEEREYWKELQEWLIESFHQQVYERWLPWSLLSGRVTLENGQPLPAAKLDKFSAATWLPRRWAWIDPVKDVQAQLEARRGGLISTQQLIREAGRDPETVYREIAEDVRQMEAAGVPPEMIQAMFIKNVQAAVKPGAQTEGGENGEE
ncbi:phage portal protein, lambda family [Paracoccus homiensis]|uniref:Phage portal protein, lambda family n=1 Tax=Paracoccus homiensis TaxID=364199 RepID=A0A1H9YBA9_9RHOB|nr:phage portal protein, lambda family [Paracoccus homiensis]